MILRPQPRDFKIIGFYLGKVILGVAACMLIPMATSLATWELNPLFDFIISFLVCTILASTLYLFCYTTDEPKWVHGMIIVSFSWMLVALLGAIPLYLSGHYLSFLDAFFEAVSGFTTTGLTLAQDLGHMSYGHNIWRHLTMFMGGQGIVVIVLSFFVGGASGSFRLYVGEGRDEQILPNIRETSRFIWMVSLTYLFLGTLLLGIMAIFAGLPFWKAMFHGACVFMAAFDTGGFTPQQQNIAYYHSLAFEIMTLVFMILGIINFKLHYALWTGKRKEILKNIEIRTVLVSSLVIFSLIAIGLTKINAYPGAIAMFRKGFYQLVSAHTGTGYANIYCEQFIHEWGSLSLLGLILAMSFGGCSCSTSGGIKAMRLGMITKVFIGDVRRHVAPEAAVFVDKFHHIKELILTDKQIRAACLVTIAYISVYFFGALIGMMCGYPFVESLFESVSAAANVGLSSGITTPTMPVVLKVTYIVQMWAGRLEFISVFVLVGFIVALIKGK